MEKLKSLYMDSPIWQDVNVDDFIVAVGKKKSNSVYHIAEVKLRPHPKNPRMVRHHMKVFKSNLLIALKRDPEQQLIPMTWYSRNKKKK